MYAEMTFSLLDSVFQQALHSVLYDRSCGVEQDVQTLQFRWLEILVLQMYLI